MNFSVSCICKVKITMHSITSKIEVRRITPLHSVSSCLYLERICKWKLENLLHESLNCLQNSKIILFKKINFEIK